MSTSVGFPVNFDELEFDHLEDGIALCLSGGGYRAMLFHLGSLWRLNEAGLLPRLARISSVSGGSIVAAYLGLRWKSLKFDAGGIATNFEDQIVRAIRGLANRTIDKGSILGGVFLPGSVAERVEKKYDEHLFRGANLQALPDSPRFVINATNVQSGVLWRFSKPYMRDYRVGKVEEPTVSLALAVAASSAFPPVLSPVALELSHSDFVKGSGKDLQRVPFTTDVVLTDGGVYDNLGLETAWKRYRTLLVSDGGGQMEPEEEPKGDWARHSYRILNIIDNQVRSLRKRQLIESFKRSDSSTDPADKTWRKGAYWGIRTDIKDYGLQDSLPAPHSATMNLAGVPTRLKRLDARLQERLINWGFAVCDSGIRKHFDNAIAKPNGFPYEVGV